MGLISVVALLLFAQQLWIAVQGEPINNCPSYCKCKHGDVGLVAHCSELYFNQNFPSSIVALNITDAKPKNNMFVLKSKIFEQIHLIDLQSIRIVNSSLSLIDEYAFSNMENLNYVDLSSNRLTRIHPDTFKDNENLQQLVLSGNQDLQLVQSLTEPSYFLKSSKISDLDLSKCGISQLTSETFNELRNLKNLNLSSNNLVLLTPEMFEMLDLLEGIDLSNNEIKDVDHELFIDSDELNKLILSNNSISKFDDVEISNLNELDLSGNIFKSITVSTLDGVPDVKNVIFFKNMIETIEDDAFTELNKLRYLDLSHNMIKGPLSYFLFETNGKLEILSLAHNPDLAVFKGFFGDFKNLYNLDLSNCGLIDLSEDAFSNLQQISILNLSHNKLTQISPTTLTRLSHLNDLDLSNNLLTVLSDGLFLENMDLRKLTLSGNRFNHLPTTLFEPLINLDSLDISKCHLESLWTVHESSRMRLNNVLSKLSTLNLRGNNFITLRKHTFDSMVSLKVLDISENPFHCYEDFVLLIEWLLQSKMTPSLDMEAEHAKLHWNDMLSKACRDYSPAEEEHTDKNTVVHSVSSTEKIKTNGLNHNILKSKESNTIQESIPGIDYVSDFGLVPEHVIVGENSPGDSEYSWVWPLFLVLLVGLSILLALFNLIALLLYRTGRNYKVAGYRSTFITPLTGNLKVKRDAGLFYQKLYEECSVPNTVPIVKTHKDSIVKTCKKNTIITSAGSKGENMV